VTATLTARRAADSPVMEGLARWGLAARGTVYLLIGWLALMVAMGDDQGEANQRGALQELAQHTGGTIVLWLLAFGLCGYALWRFSEAAFGVTGKGDKKGPRFLSLVRGIIYASLAVSAFALLVQHKSGSQARSQEEWTATVMGYPAGRWAVGLAGVILVVVGVALAIRGLRRSFEKHLELARMNPATRRTVRALGVVGTTARGVIFTVTGVLVISAAWTFDPSKARGLDGALRTLAEAPAGPWVLGAVALGLLFFGGYGFAEAVWRKT
jgi:hypothetical protein